MLNRLPTRWFSVVAACGSLTLAALFPTTTSAQSSSPIAFIREQCLECHTDASGEGGFDATDLLKSTTATNLGDPAIHSRWVRVFDRVEQGEMPPADAAELDEASKEIFLNQVGSRLREVQRSLHQQLGRVQSRRLTNIELERTLQDLLLIDQPLSRLMPVEPRSGGFVNLASHQSMSHFQLQGHLTVVDAALDAAFDRACLAPKDLDRVFEVEDIVGKRGKQRNRDPELRKGLAVTWSHGLIFYGRISSTRVKESGWYDITVTASAIDPPPEHGVWCSVRSGACESGDPLMAWIGSFEATQTPKTLNYQAWIPAGHMLEIRPADVTLKKIKTNGGQVGVGEGEGQGAPGLGLHRVVMRQIHPGGEIADVRKRLFGDLTMKWDAAAKASFPALSDLDAAARDRALAERMMAMAELAFRRPVERGTVIPYIELALDALNQPEPANVNERFVAALRAGYRALLCSPRFLYLTEPASAEGQLDDWAIAARMSYFLCGAPPDQPLRAAADAGKLMDPAVRAAQADRMLQTGRGRGFIKDFADQWLDLVDIDFTEPDRKLFPSFDPVVQNAMLAETHLVLQRMLDEDRPIRELVDSRETFLNERLARYYGVKPVEGDMQLVSFTPNEPRGGLLGHGSILKVTANGNDTSPVLRGIWVSERLLACEIPPPPSNVPAVEPDIRGATTIRELLAKHQADSSCAACHRKIDPAGFALENFDAGGRWRDKYLQLDGKRYKPAAKVDASFVMPDGEAFDDFLDFRALVAQRDDQLARSLAQRLLTYATGAEITFVDRKVVDAIIQRTRASSFGFRSIVKEVVQSETFLTK